MESHRIREMLGNRLAASPFGPAGTMFLPSLSDGIFTRREQLVLELLFCQGRRTGGFGCSADGSWLITETIATATGTDGNEQGTNSMLFRGSL